MIQKRYGWKTSTSGSGVVSLEVNLSYRDSVIVMDLLSGADLLLGCRLSRNVRMSSRWVLRNCISCKVAQDGIIVELLQYTHTVANKAVNGF